MKITFENLDARIKKFKQDSRYIFEELCQIQRYLCMLEGGYEVEDKAFQECLENAQSFSERNAVDISGLIGECINDGMDLSTEVKKRKLNLQRLEADLVSPVQKRKLNL